MGETFVHRVRVPYGDCDPGGIVFNPNFLSYFDVVLVELWRAAHGSWNDLNEHGVHAVLAEASLRFRASARFDDVLELRTNVTRLGTTSMTMTIEVMRDDELLVEGTLRHVFIDAHSAKKTEIPDWVRAALGRFASK